MGSVLDSGINPAEPIIIYGAGIAGITRFCMLLSEDIETFCFCDNDPYKQEVRIMNKPVISKEKLLAEYRNVQVLVGIPEHDEAIREELTRKGIEKIFSVKGDKRQGIQIDNALSIPREGWHWLVRLSMEKQLYVYMRGLRAESLYKKMQLTGIECKLLAEDMIGLSDIDNSKSMILIPYEDIELREFLESEGYRHKKHFRRLNELAEFNYEVMKIRIPDVNVGLTYDFGSNYPGYAVYGDDKASYKIMIQGDSNSHVGLYPFKMWIDYLYDKLTSQGISVQIFAGGIRTYNIQTMAMKMIRDLPDIKPDMVICYSGNTNSGLHQYITSASPFSNKYTRAVCYRAAQDETLYESKELVYGVRKPILYEEWPELLASDYLYANDVMKSVCDMRGIPFFSFFNAYAGMGDVNSLPALDRERCYHETRYMEARRGRRVVQEFCKLVKSQLRDYQYDHTELFKGMDNIYIDSAHVNERGNQIIADHVYEVIKDSLKK